jgi:linoleoyl-CoA desaturase
MILAVPHLNRHSVFKKASPTGMLETDWFSHAVEVTIDASPSSKLLNWFAGGLNTHAIHHAFPGICHIHYYNLTPILAETAREYGIEYKQSGFWNLIREHFALLAELGADPSSGEQYMLKTPTNKAPKVREAALV